MRGFTDPTKFAKDLSFMTEEDWDRLEEARDREALEHTRRTRAMRDQAEEEHERNRKTNERKARHARRTIKSMALDLA